MAFWLEQLRRALALAMQLVHERAKVEEQRLAPTPAASKRAPGAEVSHRGLLHHPQDALSAALHREVPQDMLARAPSSGPSSKAWRTPAATSWRAATSIRTPASPTTLGMAVTFITTGTQPASMASATARPKPSWSDACT